MYFVNCQSRVYGNGRICIGRYSTKKKAEAALPLLEKEYPGYCRFTVNSKPNL